uniref:G-protein coupled receptors family 1 profile domain-containing protein n=1 Tax=Branchiostoma floridae TaxID=7739 RepID=C3YR89_BRAFL|eukprot:XP_002601074.1 hypothetical protein BRAFLDRAFT_75509 [Branchiostoma floridae]
MYRVGTTFVICIITVPRVGIGTETGPGLNVTKDSDFRSDSSPRNGSSESCDDTFAVSNTSEIGVNISSNVHRCVLNESSTPDVSLSETSVSGGGHGSTGGVFVLAVAICLGVWSVVANSLPLAAIVKNQQLHTPAYILMANLAASDVLAGIVFVLAGSTVLHSMVTGAMPSVIVSRLRFTSIILSGVSSANSLMALTAERYWFIVHGLTYVNNVTNDKCKVAIVIVWVWSVVLAIVPCFDWHCAGYSDQTCLPIGGGLSYGSVVVILVFVFIPMAAIFLFNMGILRCLCKHMNAIAAQEAVVGAQPSTSKKSAITIIIITVVFLIGWLPIFSAMLTKDAESLHRTMVFVILNSSINPVIYGFRLKEVRRGVARLFCANSSRNGNMEED